ncbi:MAG: ATP-binding protein [Candidatus Binatia bacterium]
MVARPWVLERKTTAALVIVAAALLTAGLSTVWLVGEARRAGDLMRRTLEIEAQLGRLETNLLEAEAGQRGFLLTGTDRELARYERGVEASRATLARLERLNDNPVQKERSSEIARLATARLAALGAAVDRRRGSSPETALDPQHDRAEHATERIRTLLAEAQAEEDRVFAKHRAARAQRFQSASLLGIGSGALGLVVVVLCAQGLNRSGRRRQDAERRRHESEGRLRVTLQSIGDAVIATDTDGRIVFMNPVAERLTGWPEAEAAGRPLEQVFRIINEHTRGVVESPVTKVLREAHIVGLDNHTLLVTRSGAEIPIDDSGAPIRDTSKDMMGVVLVFRDISDRKQMDAKREALLREEAARRAAERANAAKDEFLAVLSHELRSPLQGILSWLEVLRVSDGHRAQQQRARAAIERGVRQQAQLVNDLLDASRIVAGKLQVERAPVPIAPLVEGCVEEVRAMAHEQGLELHAEVGDCGVVLGDKHRLHQSVANLLGNAVKFTPRGGRIETRCNVEGNEVVISVRDTGEGIAPEFLPQLFDRFTQSANARLRSSAGLGLGLSIARQIIELHGGSMSALSDGVGQGATFAIRLPRADHGSATPSRRARTEGASLAGLTILVVDDDEDTRESLRLLLTLRGATVHCAATVQDALAINRREQPTILLSDISMPDQDGYHLIEVVRRDSNGQKPFAIAITGFAVAEDRARSARAGFDAHVAKPVDLDELVTTIRTLVDNR